MNNISMVSLDSFQLIIAIYLFYVAAKGSGTLYRFGDLPEEDQIKVKPKLRLIYFLCGLIALLETGVCMIQNSMFTLVQTESGSAEYIQNFQLEFFPALTYSTLNILSTALSGLIILILAITFLWLRSKAIKE
ncbi:MAG: hypothetical protein IIX88_04610 [Firmicutes bacterium]|nr:hypothetical protein [Bacillota bacterium]MBQ2270526.1 hypothetical protein [Bacillota bacterium]